MSEFEAGTIIDGRYRVLHRLGAGGMADVYLAQDEQLDREVALKLLHRRFAEDPGFVERFRREAQSAASLQHPNVVSVFDRGTFDDTYYIAMEYLDGRTLKRLIREEAPLETSRAIDLTIQMLKAARFAHRRGVIHRDLKPHNVIVDSGDHVKVTDFGIARAGASDMTETGSIMGTAQYLSPEQAQGHAVSAPSDLYSIGIVLYEMLTGRVPFDGESPVSIALKHVSEAPIPPSQFNPEIPSALEQVVLWSLNKDPADRPADADQFIMALEQVREALSAPAGEVTASMRALATGTGLVPVGATPHTSLMPADAADGNGGAVGLAFEGDQLDRHHDDDEHDHRKTPIWPWIAGLVVVLLLIGGGVTAYLLTRPQKVLLPAVVNLKLPEAQRQLQGDGFVVITNSEPSNFANGIVIAQNPLGDARVKSGSIVTLNVSTGPATTTVPSVAQLTQAQAEAQIRQAGLRVSQIMSETSTSVPAGDATRTYPVGGASVSRGTKVILYMSSGLAVPDVVGDNVGDAENALTEFNVHVVPHTTTTATPGTVLSQSPTFGKAVGQNGVVTLTVAQAPSTVKVPRVVGDTPSQAVTTLTAAGLNSAQVPTTVRNLNLVGLVVSQFPTSNSMVKKGKVVDIMVGQAAPSNSGGTGGPGGNGGADGTGGAGTTNTHTTSSTPTTTSTPSTTT
jgi:beta-lactam-binding protein with PASTA domain/predicted Ser/Thr protein kinase